MRLTTTTLTVVLLSAASVQAQAQAVPGTLHSCESITSDTQRLACFDREIAKLESARAGSVAPAPAESKPNMQASTAVTSPERSTSVASANTPATAAPAPLTPAQSFGFSGDKIRALEARQGGAPAPVKLKKLTAQLTSASQNASGHWVFTLDNGQVWRQSETRDFRATAGTAVKISSGAMGSFWLETGPHNWTRVERVL